MNIREINEEYSVSGQITVDEVDEVKALGFKSIVCHRPDGEEFGQPEFAAVAKRAEELGLKIKHVPVGPMGVTPDAVADMVDLFILVLPGRDLARGQPVAEGFARGAVVGLG